MLLYCILPTGPTLLQQVLKQLVDAAGSASAGEPDQAVPECILNMMDGVITGELFDGLVVHSVCWFAAGFHLQTALRAPPAK
jgi:hypothetical protein